MADNTGPATKRLKLEQTYEQYAPGAMRLAFLLTGDRQQAEDLVQDSFVKMVGSFTHIRRPEAVWSYLRRSIINLHNSRLRRLRLERRYLETEGIASLSGAAARDGVEQRDEMWHRLQTLPTRQRAAIVLRYYEDLSEADTAEVLGCTKAAVKSLTARATATLRVQIGGTR